MKMDSMKSSWRGTNFTNRVLLASNIGLTLVVALLAISVMLKKSVVTVHPPAISKEYSIGADWASQTYLEAWALFMSQALGNVTPSSAKFVKGAVEPMLSPKVYQPVMVALEKQVAEIRDNHITLFFEPRRILHERETDKIFIHGQSVLEAPSGDRTRKQRTYEFQMEMMNYMPSVTYVDTYEGPPRTLEELGRLKRMNDKRRSAGVKE